MSLKNPPTIQELRDLLAKLHWEEENRSEPLFGAARDVIEWFAAEYLLSEPQREAAEA